jgi:hypothetical protein
MRRRWRQQIKRLRSGGFVSADADKAVALQFEHKRLRRSRSGSRGRRSRGLHDYHGRLRRDGISRRRNIIVVKWTRKICDGIGWPATRRTVVGSTECETVCGKARTRLGRSARGRNPPEGTQAKEGYRSRKRTPHTDMILHRGTHDRLLKPRIPPGKNRKQCWMAEA